MCSQDVQRLEAALSAERADHAASRGTLRALQQEAELEQRRAASEARHRQAEEELAAQRQQGELLSSRCVQLTADHVAAVRAAAQAQAQAAAEAAEHRSQLAEAQQAAQTAVQEASQTREEAAAQAEVQRTQHEGQLAAAAAAAAAQLTQQQADAAAQLAAREAALQHQLDAALAGAQRERQQLEQAAAEAAAADAAQWQAWCAQLAGKMQQLAGNLGLDCNQALLSAEDAALSPLRLARRAASGRSTSTPDSEGFSLPPSVPPLPPAAADVHAGLRQLYRAALDVRISCGCAQAEAGAAQEAVERLRAQAAEEQRRWHERLERELRQLGVTADLQASERAAAAAAEWRAKLAAVEDRLQGELAQLTRVLDAAQQSREALEAQSASLAGELLKVQHRAAQDLEAAAARAAAQQQAAAAEAADAARQAAEQQARAEAEAREEIERALERMGEQHVAALRVAEARHEGQLEGERQRAEQAAQHHKQELRRVDEAWQLKWATEADRLQRQHASNLEGTAATQRQVRRRRVWRWQVRNRNGACRAVMPLPMPLPLALPAAGPRAAAAAAWRGGGPAKRGD